MKSIGGLLVLALSFAAARLTVDNGGTVAAVAGRGFAIVAADTRLSEGYTIRSRNISRITRVTPRACLASAGCFADATALHQVLARHAKEYEWSHGCFLSTTAFAQKLSRVLYNRRLLPYHAFSVVAGIDDEGLGAAFTYDAVGSFERGGAVCSGRAQVRTRPFRNTEALIGGRGSFCAQALI